MRTKVFKRFPKRGTCSFPTPFHGMRFSLFSPHIKSATCRAQLMCGEDGNCADCFPHALPTYPGNHQCKLPAPSIQSINDHKQNLNSDPPPAPPRPSIFRIPFLGFLLPPSLPAVLWLWAGTDNRLIASLAIFYICMYGYLELESGVQVTCCIFVENQSIPSFTHFTNKPNAVVL